MSAESFEPGNRVKAVVTVRRWRIPEGAVGVVKAARPEEHEVDVEFPDIGLIQGAEDYHFRLVEDEDEEKKKA